MLEEISLSNDLNVITAEINSYKQVAGQAILEIGKRLKHVKENDLVHGEFGKWLESIDMSKSQANRFMKVVEELEGSNFLTSRNIGVEALYYIATLPPEEREKEHTLSSGQTKTVDEMTVRELQEIKKQLKQVESERDAERKERERLENQEPKIIEVVPDDYDYFKGNYEAALNQQKYYKKQMEEMKKELDNLHNSLKRERSRMTDNDAEKKEKEVKLLTLEASKSVLKTKISIDDFLQEVAVTSYRRGAIAAASDGTKNKLREGIDDLKNFIKEMELALDGTIEQ